MADRESPLSPGSPGITLVAALAENRAIGLQGRMPWHLPAELRHFRQTTLGKPVVMGRRTWESIGRPLPGRQNIVVSRNAGYALAGAALAGSLDEALALATGPEAMIIGGGMLYRLALPRASRMVLTLVRCRPDADTWFPRWDPREWRQTASERVSADADHAYDFEMTEWRRVSASGAGPGIASDPPA